MSIAFSGTLRRSGGIVSAIGKQLKQVNLKAVKRITVTLDPFHENATPTRDFLFHLSCPKIASTNPNCALKTDIVCDRRSPSVVFHFIPTVQGETKLKTVEINSENLSVLELLQLTNKHISAVAPKEDPVNVIKTKSEKKAIGGKAGKRK